MKSPLVDTNTVTLLDIIKRMLPEGSSEDDTMRSAAIADPSGPHWTTCPPWPADVFAVIATIVDQSGCYTVLVAHSGHLASRLSYLKRVRKFAAQWKDVDPAVQPDLVAPLYVSRLWTQVAVQNGDVLLSHVVNNPTLIERLVELFAIADEACAGVGWSGASPSVIEVIATASLIDRYSGSLPRLPYAPQSLCRLVPHDVAIVLPKSLTPSVGCTVRSLSHHLALLPGSTQAKPGWYLAHKGENKDFSDGEKICVLVVPFPFNVSADCFEVFSGSATIRDGDGGAGTSLGFTPGFFTLDQRWLKDRGRRITGARFVREVLQPLLLTARAENGGTPVHGVVMPECALSTQLAGEVAAELRRIGSRIGLEFLVTGVLDDVSAEMPRNLAYTYVFDYRRSNTAVANTQTKHHRWSVDRSQVSRYGLRLSEGDTRTWWEFIDVSKREIPFFAIRENTSFTVLVCEDLARSDPAMPVIRAVGPNLVVALLMDGPQLRDRWPARYATVLADDPGSSVLSVTCAGMVDRSNWQESRPVRSVGLWRESGGRTQELSLPVGSHALALNIVARRREQHSLDNRNDGKRAVTLELDGMIPISLGKIPLWI